MDGDTNYGMVFQTYAKKLLQSSRIGKIQKFTLSRIIWDRQNLVQNLKENKEERNRRTTPLEETQAQKIQDTSKE